MCPPGDIVVPLLSKRLFSLLGLVALGLFLLGFPQASLVPLVIYGFHTLTWFSAGQNNLHHYFYAANLRHTLQKITGPLAVAFAIFVIFTPQPLIVLAPSLGIVAAKVIYDLGFTIVVFHFCNGVWNALVMWGIVGKRMRAL